MTITRAQLLLIDQVAKAAVANDSHAQKEINENYGACGFAWVNVHGLRKNDKNPDRKVLEGFGFSFASYDKAFQLWVSDYGQSIYAKEIYAHAFAKELKALGIEKAYGGSRLD